MHMNGSLYRKRSGSHTWRRSFKPLLPQRLNERGSQSKPPYDARTSRAYLHTRGHSAPAPALWRFSHMSAVSCTRGPKRGWGRVWERERVCVCERLEIDGGRVGVEEEMREGGIWRRAGALKGLRGPCCHQQYPPTFCLACFDSLGASLMMACVVIPYSSLALSSGVTLWGCCLHVWSKRRLAADTRVCYQPRHESLPRALFSALAIKSLLSFCVCLLAHVYTFTLRYTHGSRIHSYSRK